MKLALKTWQDGWVCRASFISQTPTQAALNFCHCSSFSRLHWCPHPLCNTRCVCVGGNTWCPCFCAWLWMTYASLYERKMGLILFLSVATEQAWSSLSRALGSWCWLDFPLLLMWVPHFTAHPRGWALCLQDMELSADRTWPCERSPVSASGLGGPTACPVFLFWFS